nr:acyltransferase [Pararoseomonas baculiformis]
MLALTSVRGIAAWWVVLYHFREALPAATPSWLLDVAARGYMAVDFFFQLSGFILAYTYSRSFGQPSFSSAREFWVARFARIYPLHAFLLLLFLANPIAIALFSSEGTIGERYNLGYYLLSWVLVQNWGFVGYLAWNVPAWSISVEWMAYLTFPVLAFVLVKYVTARVALVATFLGTYTLLVALWNYLNVGLGDNIPQLGLMRCLLQFSMGMILYRIHALSSASATRDDLLAILGMGLLGLAIGSEGIRDYVAVPIASSLIIYGLASQGRIASALGAITALVWIGEVSYSTYMSHYFIRDWVRFLLVGAGQPSLFALAVYMCLTLLASSLLYRFVEQPGRYWLRRLGRQRIRASS